MFFSSVGGATTNAIGEAKRPSNSQGSISNATGDNKEVDKGENEKEKATMDDNKEDIVFVSVSYFVVCKKDCAETANIIHKALDENQTENQNQRKRINIIKRNC